MAPILLLLLAAGGVALIARSSSGAVRAPADHVVDSGGKLDSLVVAAKDEKFMDPLYLVFGQTDAVGRRTYAIATWPNRPHNGIGGGLLWLFNRHGEFGWDEGLDDRGEVQAGYEYFVGTPYTAEARIKQMRAVINERKKNPAPLSTDRAVFLANMIKSSEAQIYEMGLKLAESYSRAKKSATDAARYAEAMGVSPAAVVAEASDMLAKYSGSMGMVVGTLKSYGPMAQTFLSAGLDAYGLLTSDGGSTTEAMKWAQIAEKLSLYIPVVGPYVSAMAGVLAGGLASELRDNLASCNAGQAEANAALSSLTDQKLPIPLHAYQVFHGACGKDNVPPSSLGWLTTLFARVARDWYVLPLEAKVYAYKWWGVAAVYAAHPDVLDVFTYLGFDASGGMIACDEQVLLVAAPIAAAHGIDVDTFAIALWKKSKGWRGAATPRNIGIGSASSVRAFSEGDTYRIPTNAWVLQWCQLAEEALDLAAAWPRAVPADVAVPAVLSAESVKLGTEAFKAAEGLKLPGGLKF